LPLPARLFAVCALIAASLGAHAASAAAATALYPDLKTLPPRDLKLDRADVSVAGTGDFHNVLRFSNTVWNDGAGKLVMRGAINPSTKDGAAVQRVYDDAGGFVDSTIGRFYWHAEHSHYHYDDWGRYQLFTKAEYDSWVAAGRPATLPSGVEVGTKTTSCVMDEEFIKTLPNTPWPAAFPSSGCMPDGSNMLLEGISPGWGDTYDYWRYEQWIDLGQSTLADGDYVLRSVTDDKNLVHESAGKADATRESQTANEGITPLRIAAGALVDVNAPSGSLAINDVDSQTTNPQVTVKALGRDDILGPGDIAGVDTVRLSNDGVTWKSYTWTQGPGSTPMAIAWNLTDPSAGGNATGGTKTVYAQYRDRSGKWSASVTDTIVYKAPAPPAPPTGYAATVAADSPVSYWRLAEASGTTALDERGANTGAYTNAPGLGSAGLLAGEPANKAVALDGVSDYVSVADSASLDLTNQITVEAWIKPAAIPAAGQFASVVTKREAYAIQFNGPRLEFTVMQSGARQRLQAAAGAIVAGTTYHVVGTFDGTTQRLYINGVEVGSRAQTGAATVGTNSLTIGSWGSSEYFTGTIDEVAVYNSVLSAARVKAHTDAAGGSTPPPPPPPPPAPTLSAPTGLTAAQASPYAIDVRWTDTNTAEENYVLERSTSSTFTSLRVVTLPAGTTTYADSGLTASTAYYYRVKATAGTTSSPWSSTATATTPAAPSINSYSQVVLGDGPSSYWRLGETSGTVAGDQKAINPGAYGVTPLLGQASLLTSDTQNRAVGVSGDDYMRVPASPSLNLTSAVTLEAWIKPTSIPAVGFASVLTKAESYSLQFNSGRLELTIMQSGVRKRLQAPSGAVVTGRTYHVVGTFDGVTQRLYLNGVQVASVALAGTASISTNALYVGAWSSTSEFFNGSIDEAAVYARVLTAAQVKSHYDSGVAAPSGTAAVAATTAAPTPTNASTTQVLALSAPLAAVQPASTPASAPAPVTAPVAAAPRNVAPARRSSSRTKKPACRKQTRKARGGKKAKRCRSTGRRGAGRR
jgi:hypothetical protein